MSVADDGSATAEVSEALRDALRALRERPPRDAVDALDALLEERTAPALAQVLRARAARLSGDPDGAAALLSEARLSLGEHPQLLAELGYVALARGDGAAAVRYFEQLTDALPEDPDAHFNLALAYRSRGRHAAARVSFERALDFGTAVPAQVEAELGQLMLVMRRPDEAQRHIERALSFDADSPHAQTAAGELAAGSGDFAAAEAALRNALDVAPDHAAANLMLARIHAFANLDDPDIGRMRQCLAQAEVVNALRESLDFALGKACDDCADYDAAFAHVREANQSLGRRVAAYDASRQEALTDALIETCDHAFLQRTSLADSGDRPVFIAGLPRCGATLIELSLARHSAVTMGGELPYFDKATRMRVSPWPDGLASVDSGVAQQMCAEYLDVVRQIDPGARVSNRHPANVLHLGLIAALLPDATLIHCDRDLLDTCLSLYFAPLPPPLKAAYCLQDIAHFILQRQRLIAHWHELLGDRLLRLSYEDFVIDPQAGVEALLGHADLPFEQACVTPREADTVVTGPAVWQVRQPIHIGSCERWRHYASHLRDAADVLGVSLD